MKIGILTFHRSINNGAVMQCYSLSKQLKKQFPDSTVEVIDYHMPKIEKFYSPKLSNHINTKNFTNFAKSIFFLVRNPFHTRHLKKRFDVFRNCLDILPLSKEFIFSDDQTATIEYINKNYDILIVGSDAIWNYVLRGFPNVYFPDKNVTVTKLSYAASCYNMDFLLCENTRNQIGDILSDFSFIGVRDKATEEFVKWSGCKNSTYHTCDPTAFLNIDDLPIDEDALKLKLKNKGFNFDKPTIGMMGYKPMLKMIRKLYGRKYQIAALYNHVPGADVQLYDLTPYEWAYVFRYFKITFTTYFHGTMLSLRNGIPVICIALNTRFSKKHTPKTLDVLQRLGFSDWYFKTNFKGLNFDKIKEKSDELIALQPKDKIIEKMNIEAQSFDTFKEALEKIINN